MKSILSMSIWSQLLVTTFVFFHTFPRHSSSLTRAARVPAPAMSVVAARALALHAQGPRYAGSPRTRGFAVPKVANTWRVSKPPRALVPDTIPDEISPNPALPNHGTPSAGHGGCFVAHCVDGDSLASTLLLRESGTLDGSSQAVLPLHGVTFAVKDNMDVVGRRTGAGSPAWLATRGKDPAVKNAHVVALLLKSGAVFVGKTQMDELAWALQGENAHYGTPINPASPSRIPGGSSSGSAVAVAGKFCDIALGTDTAGSIRVPASYCGVFGFRPTHGKISLFGVVPLAPSFDTVGWFARDAATLEKVGKVLLPTENPEKSKVEFKTVLIAEDAFAACDAETVAVLLAGVEAFGVKNKLFRDVPRVSLGGDDACEDALGLGGGDEKIPPAPPLTTWWDFFRQLQTKEVWDALGFWVTENDALGSFGPGVRERFQAAADSEFEKDDDGLKKAAEARFAVETRITALLRSGNKHTIVVLPTAPGPAIERTSAAEERLAYRAKQLMLTTASGFAKTPQVTIPCGFVHGAPVGISLMSSPGTDLALLRLAKELTE